MSEIDDAINDIINRSEAVIGELEDYANTVNNIPVPDANIPTASFGSNSALNLGTNADAVIKIITDKTTPHADDPLFIHFNGDNTDALINLRAGRGSQSNTEAIEDGDIAGGFLCSPYDGSDYIDTAAIKFIVDGVVNAAATPLSIVLETTDEEGTTEERFVVTSNGNIGIGDSSPLHSLTIEGQDIIGAPTEGTYGTLCLKSGAAAGSGGSLIFAAKQNENGFAAITGGLTNGTNNSIGSMLFYTREATDDSEMTERMRIKADGNIDIGGVGSPSAGALAIKTAADGYAISIEENAGGETYQIGVNVDGDFLIYNSKNANPTFIVDDGNRVGINVDPGVDLDIADDDIASSCYARVRSSSESGYIWHDGTQSVFGLYWPTSSSYLQFYDDVAGAERGHIKSDGTFVWTGGNVGIGDTNPDKNLVVKGAGAEIVINDTDATDTPRLRFRESGATSGMVHTDGSELILSTGTTEAMRIDTSGNLLVGATSAAGSGESGVTIADISDAIGQVSIAKSYSGTTGAMKFYYGTTQVGRVDYSDTSTTYITSSDVRLKENIVDAPAGNIDSIKVRSFDWKIDGSHQEYGFIAQELETVAPYAVSKGETDEDTWGVDYSKLVPMLVKEIQDLKLELQAIKATL